MFKREFNIRQVEHKRFFYGPILIKYMKAFNKLLLAAVEPELSIFTVLEHMKSLCEASQCAIFASHNEGNYICLATHNFDEYRIGQVIINDTLCQRHPDLYRVVCKRSESFIFVGLSLLRKKIGDDDLELLDNCIQIVLYVIRLKETSFSLVNTVYDKMRPSIHDFVNLLKLTSDTRERKINSDKLTMTRNTNALVNTVVDVVTYINILTGKHPISCEFLDLTTMIDKILSISDPNSNVEIVRNNLPAKFVSDADTFKELFVQLVCLILRITSHFRWVLEYTKDNNTLVSSMILGKNMASSFENIFFKGFYSLDSDEGIKLALTKARCTQLNAQLVCRDNMITVHLPENRAFMLKKMNILMCIQDFEIRREISKVLLSRGNTPTQVLTIDECQLYVNERKDFTSLIATVFDASLIDKVSKVMDNVPSAILFVNKECLNHFNNNNKCKVYLFENYSDKLLESALESQLNIPPNGSHRSLHILVADDNPIDLKIMAKLLQKCGEHYITLKTDGLQVLQEVASRKHYDLFILDLNMPHLTGLEAFEVIKNKQVRPDVWCYTSDPQNLNNTGLDKIIRKPAMFEDIQDALRFVKV